MSSVAVRGQGTGDRGQGTAIVDDAPATLRRDEGHAAASTQYSVLSTSGRSESPSATTRPVLLRATGLEKSYRKGKLVVPVLKGVDFQIREGGFIAVVGQSGC